MGLVNGAASLLPMTFRPVLPTSITNLLPIKMAPPAPSPPPPPSPVLHTGVSLQAQQPQESDASNMLPLFTSTLQDPMVLAATTSLTVPQTDSSLVALSGPVAPAAGAMGAVQSFLGTKVFGSVNVGEVGLGLAALAAVTKLAKVW